MTWKEQGGCSWDGGAAVKRRLSPVQQPQIYDT